MPIAELYPQRRRGLGQDEFGMEPFDLSVIDTTPRVDDGGGGGAASFGVFDDGSGGFIDSQGNPVSSDGSQIDYAAPASDWIPYTDASGNPAWYSSTEGPPPASDVMPGGIDTSGVDISALPFGGSAILDPTQLEQLYPSLDAQQLSVLQQATLLNVDPNLLSLTNTPNAATLLPPAVAAAAQGLSPTQVSAIQQAMQQNALLSAATRAAGGAAAPSGGGSSGGGGAAKPAAGLTPEQLAAALAQLKQQLAQAQATGNTAQAAQLQAQIKALGSGTSWFTGQTIIAGVPNWEILAGGGVIAFVLFGSGTQYEARSPLRRRNPRRHRRSR